MLLSLRVSAQTLDVTFNTSEYKGGYNISCYGATDGRLEAIIIGGTPPYSFQWSNGAFTKTIFGLAAGTYSITVTDSLQASVTKSYTLMGPDAMTGSLIVSTYNGGYNVSAQGANDGWITTEIGGGAPPYTFQWSNGVETENNHELTSGAYSVVVRDVNQCQLQLSASLTQPTPLHIVSITSPLHNGYNVSCKGGEDGAVNLTVSGGVPPYTYQWNNGNFTEDLQGLKAGNYSVQVKDANSVQVTASITLSQPAGLEVALSAPTYPNGHHTTCYNCSNGSVTTTVTGGVMPYTYSWNSGQSTQNLSNLMAGTYAVLVTDANGCTKPDVKIDLTEPDRDDWTMMGNANSNPDSNFIGTVDSAAFTIRSKNIDRIRIDPTGQIVLNGTIKLDSVSSDSVRSVFVDANGYLRIDDPGGGGIQICSRPSYAFYKKLCPTDANYYFYGSFNPLSKLVIGDPLSLPGTYKMYVTGGILTEKLRIADKTSSFWADDVFNLDYELLSIADLERYVRDNRHLPGIPTSKDVEEEGIDVASIQGKLLRKIEELHLYIIQLESRIKVLEK